MRNICVYICVRDICIYSFENKWNVQVSMHTTNSINNKWKRQMERRITRNRKITIL